MQFTDTITLEGVRRTGDGYLVASPKVARTGIQVYAGYEVDPKNEHGLRDRPTVNVYRPEAEVFSADALKSYAHRPVTNDHPPVMVDASNWKKYSIGQTGEEITRDGESVRVPLVLMDEAAIRDVEAGKRELSMGYSAELVFGDGVTPSGQPYQVKQTNLRMNHLAVVTTARGGSSLRIGDESNERKRSMNRTLTIDGLTVELADRDAQIVDKAMKDAGAKIKDVQTKLNDAEKTIAAKDAQIAQRDAEIEKLKGQVLDEAALDARVSARSDLIAKAKAVAGDIKTTGLSDADIRKAVVITKLGDTAVKDKTPAYIDARFDILVEDAATNAGSNEILREAIADARPTTPVNDETNAYNKSVADLNSWRYAKGA